MSLYAAEFFAKLSLPFADSTVVGNTYYATPNPEGPMRLRIDFCPTIRVGEYDGLRLATIHKERGELDVVTLRFEDHKTFDRRDASRGLTPQASGYARFSVFRDRPDLVPWAGAQTNRLRDAIEQYTAIWFPGAWPPSNPSRAAAHSACRTPAPPSTRTAVRTPPSR